MNTYGYDTRRATSPIVIRTIRLGQFVNINDLQAQLYRDIALGNEDLSPKDFILDLIERLDKLKDNA